MEKEQAIDSNLKDSAQNKAVTLEKGHNTGSSSRYSAPNLPQSLNKDYGTGGSLRSAPSLPELSDKEHNIENSLRILPQSLPDILDKEQDIGSSLRSALSLSEPLDRRENVPVGDYPFRNVSLPWEPRVADLVKRLTLEEIQGQMASGGPGESDCFLLSLQSEDIDTGVDLGA